MIESIADEIEKKKTYLGNQVINTVYFGGGTPSLLTKEELELLFRTIHQNFKLNPNAEVTLEANPDDLSVEYLKDLKYLGINRLSIGLQSFNDNDLKWMNRAHSAEDSFECVSRAQELGFDNISIDLIYGLPDLIPDKWKNTIQAAINLKVQHISAYCLTVESKTALHKWVKQKKLVPSNEDQQSEQFTILVETLKNSGYCQYEISNFSLPGFESKHNSSYWKGVHYIGVGPSAHSFNGKMRSWNISNNRLYIKTLRSGEDFYESEVLSNKDKFNELLLTGLRTIYGVKLQQLEQLHKILPEFTKKLNQFEENKWLYKHEDSIFLTEEGKLKADLIASELFL